MKYQNLKYTVPYKNVPTYCLKKKIERIDLLCDKIAEGALDSDDLNHIRQILRETQYCLTNLYEERKEAQSGYSSAGLTFKPNYGIIPKNFKEM